MGRDIIKTITATIKTITMSVARSGHITIETETEDEVQEIANTLKAQPPLADSRPPGVVVTAAGQMLGDGVVEVQLWV